MIVLIILVLLLPVAAAVALRIAFPPERLRDIVEPRIEAALGRDVELGAIRLKVFPRIAVRLEDVAVANPPGFSPEPAVRLNTLDLRLRFWPLLRGRFELKQVRLAGMVVRYEVDAGGTANLFAGADAPLDADLPVSPQARAAGAAFAIEDLVLTDGRILYSDARDDRALRSASMVAEGRIGAAPTSAATPALAGRGDLSLRDIELTMRGAVGPPISLQDVTIAWNALLDLAGDSLSIPDLGIGSGSLSLNGQAAIHALRGERTLDLALASGEVDMVDLFGAVPEVWHPQGVQVAGRGRLEVGVVGKLGGGNKPDVTATLSVSALSVEHETYGPAVSGAAGTATLTAGSVSIPSFEGSLFGQPFALQLEAEGFAAPVVSGRLRADIDLARWASFQEEPTPIEGTASLDVEFSGPARERGRLSVTGPVRLSNIRYQSPSLVVPADIESATLRLSGFDVRADGVRVALGASDVELTFDGRGLLPYLLDRENVARTPAISFSARSRLLDLSELTGERTDSLGYSDLLTARLAGQQIDGRNPGDVARERYPMPPIPGVEARGDVTIAELADPPTRARDVSFEVTLAGGVLSVTDLRGDLFGGRLAGGLTFDASRGEAPFDIRYDIRLQGAQAGEFIQRWTRLGHALTGTVDFEVSGSGAFDGALLPAALALDALGSVTFTEGRFGDFGITNALIQRLNLGADMTRGFEELGGAFEIRDGSFILKDWPFEAAGLRGVVAGSAGLAGSLDLQVGMGVPASTLRNAGLAGAGGAVNDLLNQLSAGTDTIPVMVDILGTMSNPSLEIDAEALQRALSESAKGAGWNLLQDLFRRPPEP